MITFVIPDMFQALKNSDFQRDFPSLEKMLKKANIDAFQTKSNQYELLGNLFELSTPLSGAVAAIEQSVESKSKHWSCVASPVMISPNRNHLDLTQVVGFELSEDEAQSFCDEFNDYFKDDGFSFSFTEPNRWYCRCDTGFDVSEASPESICGENIAPHIPQNLNGSQWRKIFNETQMLLHHSVTNRQRAQLGKPEINSLWFWGGGRLNENISQKNFKVFSDHLYVKGLCQLSHCTLDALSACHIADHVNQTLLIMAESANENRLNWEDLFFKPTLNALQQGKIDRVAFYFNLGEKMEIRNHHFYRFWKSNDIQSRIED